MTVSEVAAVAGVANKNVLAWITRGLRGVGPLAATKRSAGGRHGFVYEMARRDVTRFLAKREALRAQRTANEQARARRALGL